MKSLFSVLAFLFFFSHPKAQQLTPHKLLSVGYTYQNQSFGEVGGKVILKATDDFLFRVGASGLFGATNGKFMAMPKAQGEVMLNFQRNVDFYHSWWAVGGVDVTNKYIAPKAGFTVLGLLDLTAGYAIPWREATLNGKQLKGLNVTIGLNIPTVLIFDLIHN